MVAPSPRTAVNKRALAVGRRIEERRKSLGLTREALADAMKVRAPTVFRWERGQFLPSVVDIVRLAKALSTSVGALVGEQPTDDAAA